LTEVQWNARPAGVASVAFHVQHIAGVIDRLFTYARGAALTDAQRAAIQRERQPLSAGEIPLASTALHDRVESALAELRAIDPSTLGEWRGVGRAQLPSTVIGCLVHGAEHSMRHVGQLSVTARVVKADLNGTASREGSKQFDAGAVRHLVLAGWAGRDQAAVEAHIRELEALGTPRPTRTPVFYRVAPSLLTTSNAIEVVGTETSGEVEFVLVKSDDGLWVGLGSDHTDRGLERSSVALSKQLCAKVVAPALWRFDDVAPHWDRIVLRSWTHRDGIRKLYQDGTFASILPVDRLLSMYAAFAGALEPGSAMFGGTIATIDAIAPADVFEIEMEDPVLERRLHHRYRITTLPANA
jgi:uncharacterized damage-inducible protein DinB